MHKSFQIFQVVYTSLTTLSIALRGRPLVNLFHFSHD